MGYKLSTIDIAFLAGLCQGAPKQRSLNKVQDVKEKSNEDPLEFQQRVFKAHRQYIESCSPREFKGS